MIWQSCTIIFTLKVDFWLHSAAAHVSPRFEGPAKIFLFELTQLMLPITVANLKETVEAQRGKALFQSAKVIRNIFHDLQRKGSVVPEQTAPSRIFCMSGPVAHVDDDQGQACSVMCDHLEVPSNEGFHFSSTEKLSVIVDGDALKLQEFNGERFLPNGDIFVGSWQGNIPEGRGKYLWSDGCMYEGEWGKGKKCGKGKISWPSGATYEGNFMGGYLHGMGTYTGIHGSTYKGNWKKSEKHGFGTKSYANGDVYEGLWKHGVQEGTGRYIWNNGNEYYGDWKGGVMNGRGLLIWATGDTFDGQWLEGLEHGHGVYTWADGSTYVGTWNRGLKDGKGLFYLPGSIYLDKSSSSGDPGSREHAISGDELTRTSSVSESDLSGGRSCRRSTRWYSGEQAILNDATTGCESSNVENIPLERRWSLEGPLEGFLTPEAGNKPWKTGNLNLEKDERISMPEQDTVVFPIVEREYVQGVLINELVKGNVTSGSIKFPRRWHKRNTKEGKRPGESIFKGHRSYDLMLNLQLGIRYSVGKITPESKRDLFPIDFGPKARIWMNFPREGSQLTPPHQSADFKWKDYCPMVFRHLREMFKIDAADYMLSICGNDGLRELSSPGKSGSVFYLSQDDRFIIKTMRKYEVKVLLGMLPNYYHHVRTNENTLITKFFGLHRVKPTGGQKVRFVVMGNIFCTDLRIHRRFDLKGSSQGRSTDNVEIDETTTLKDLDLDYVFHLEASWRDALLKQIECDCKFLESERIMDYSLLLGLHFRDPQFPTVFSPTPCPIPPEAVIPTSPPNDAGFSELERDSEGVDIDGSSTLEPHVRGSSLRADVAGDGEVDLQLPEAVRLQTQLGVNIPARADRRRPNREEEDPYPEEQYFREVYDVVLYFGIIDVLQEYDIGKKLEHAYKSLQFDSLSISAVDPNLYSKRFQDFICQIFPATSPNA